MVDKFSNEDIKEIVSRIKWNPNQLTYTIYHTVIALSIFSLFLIIYLIILHKDIKCKTKTVNMKYEELNMKYENILLKIKELETKDEFQNKLRYLTKRSERDNDNQSLQEKNKVLFANEKENPILKSAILGL